MMTVPLPGPCVASLVEARARQSPDAIALCAPHGRQITYRQIFKICRHAVQTLNAHGIGRNDRVAIVLPNGLESAAAFVAVVCGATCAPLNPSYQAEELEFYLSDLKARALLVMGGVPSTARNIALARGITLLELTPQSSGDGLFTLTVNGSHRTPSVAASAGWTEPQDTALVLHTSGTTSRPKLVLLTQRNLYASARNISDFLGLNVGDRCLNVMPLFHIHGLVGALLSSLWAGGNVFCTGGFSNDFLARLSESSATWYTAVPTMHQGILTQASVNREAVSQHRLRFIRSSSAALPPTVMAELEATFNVPVVESYGMTEAAHQMACNPLPPGRRKPGSVGIAAGPRIAVLDEAGAPLASMAVGEIAIQGENVTPGYEANPKANEQAFTADGWFRTGDQGYLDTDGYLFISGRLKEIINRGGEKISPREIDEALLEHPEVAQALTFSMPHPTLGEDVAAAVVLRPGGLAKESDLRQFLSARLSYFRIPRRIVIVAEIPKGPTGKLQRIGMANRLGISADAPAEMVSAPYVAARNVLEQSVLDLFGQVLHVQRVGIDDNFFLMGGDSLTAMQLLARIRESLGVEIPFATFFGQPTVAALANFVSTQPREPSADFQRVLDEINSLSDEEAQRLLEEELNS